MRSFLLHFARRFFSKKYAIVLFNIIIIALIVVVLFNDVLLGKAEFNDFVLYNRTLIVGVLLFSLFIVDLYYVVQMFLRKNTQRLVNEGQAILIDEDRKSFLEYIAAVVALIDREASNNNDKIMAFKSNAYHAAWFIVMGDQGSGKSSLVNSCNANFLLEDQLAALNLKKPDWLDCRVTSEMIFFELSDKIFQVKDSGGNYRYLVYFLDWVNDFKKIQPINGILYCIDIQKIIQPSYNERMEISKSYKEKIKFINKSLGARIPVYVNITKIDSLDGFSEFLRRSSKNKDDLLGMSFPLGLKSVSFLSKIYNYQFNEITKSLSMILLRGIGEISEENRSDLYSFVRQFAGLKVLLHELLEGVFSGNNYEQLPFLRSIFFVSAHQRAFSVNALKESTVVKFNTPEAILKSFSGQSFPYFINAFFDKVLLREVGLVESNNLFKIKQARKHMLAYGVSGLILLLLTSGWFYYYKYNSYALLSILNRLNVYKETSGNISYENDSTGKQYLDSLNLLRDSLDEYRGGGYGVLSIWPHLGLYKGNNVKVGVEEVYQKILSQLFLVAIENGVLNELEKFEIQDKSQEVDERSLELLRVARLLAESPESNSEVNDELLKYRVDFVMAYAKRLWQASYRGNKATQDGLAKHLSYALSNVSVQLPVELKEKLQGIQDKLARVSLAKRLYAQIKLNSSRIIPTPLNIRHEIGGKFDIVFKGNVSDTLDGFTLKNDHRLLDIYVPALFTYQGFHDFFVKEHDDVVKLAALDAWALGEEKSFNTLSAADIEQIKTEIRELYVNDYKDAWLRVINGLGVVDFDLDISKALAVLGALNSADNPYASLVSMVRKNTILFPEEIQEQAQNKANDSNKDLDERSKLLANSKLNSNLYVDVGVRLEEAFSNINSLSNMSEKKDARLYLDDINLAFSSLYDFMYDVNSNKNSPNYSLQKAIDKLSLRSEADPFFVLQRIANGMNEPLRSHFKKIADSSWNILLGMASNNLDSLWKNDVYLFFSERIKGRYPIDKSSNMDVSIEDFKEFFGKEGRTQKFYDKYLKIFLEDNRELVFSPERGIQFMSPDVLNSLDKIKNIRGAFMNEQGDINISLLVEPVDLSGIYASSVLNIDGILVEYNHGKPLAKNVVWPNPSGSTGSVSLTLNPVSASIVSYSKSDSGVWSLLRFLDRASSTSVSERDKNLKFNSMSGYATYKFMLQKPINPVTSDLFVDFVLPDSLGVPVGSKLSTRTSE